MKKEIFILGLNHHCADVSIRESFALSDPEVKAKCLLPVKPCMKRNPQECWEKQKEYQTQSNKKHAEEPCPSFDKCQQTYTCPVQECLILSTCNRVELAIVGKNESAADYMLELWAKARNKTASELKSHVYIHKGFDAVKHLFSVASSLDSLVLGEPQILGQLKDAYRKAVDDKQTKIILNRLLHKAFFVAKRVRTETAVASSAVSISYAAVELAKRIFGNMESYTAMLIGAGEMAELSATHLINAGISNLIVVNRTLERAEELIKNFPQINAKAIDFNQLIPALQEADIIISSTGAHEPIINADQVKEVLKKRKQRPMFFIDIAVPRDIDTNVNELDNVYLYDIDDLKDVVEENLAQRRSEAERAKKIVEEETHKFCTWLRSLDLQPTIVELLNRSDEIATEELNKTLKKLPQLDEQSREALQIMLAAVVKKINHEPITFLKQKFEEESGTQYIDITRQMFKLDSQLKAKK
ncbi:glutamyl-tRNA reductase [Desulfovibrio litoralis]|uniref:Glutamyl-tRNA reductase n=1 Tax=Desulfovibrio litoralis DSM 11393 TaxID=1121455 RepID=A0A1M7SD81_9BACT|nr:glutamyl-tRNA reductase [Desulfovibrio litoralis DSM 11393]